MGSSTPSPVSSSCSKSNALKEWTSVPQSRRLVDSYSDPSLSAPRGKTVDVPVSPARISASSSTRYDARGLSPSLGMLQRATSVPLVSLGAGSILPASTRHAPPAAQRKYRTSATISREEMLAEDLRRLRSPRRAGPALTLSAYRLAAAPRASSARRARAAPLPRRPCPGGPTHRRTRTTAAR